MFDRDKLKSDLLKTKQIGNPRFAKGFTFPFARTPQFDLGTYQMRICPPNQDKNPDGYVLISRAGIEKDDTNPKESTRWVALDMARSNYLMGVVTQIDKLGLLEQVSDGMKDTLKKLYPIHRYLIPIFVKADTYETVGSRNGKEYTETRYKPNDDTTVGCILELYSDSGLLTKLFSLADKYPEMSHFRNGVWFRLDKQRTKHILDDPYKKSQLTDAEKEMIVHDKYPNLVKIAERDRAAHAEIVDMIQTAWWKNSVEKMGVDFKDYGPLKSPYMVSEEVSEEVPFDLDVDTFDPLK